MAQPVNIGIVSKSRVRFEKFCNHTGEKRTPDIESIDDPFFSETNLRVLKRRIADMNVRRNVAEHGLIECD